MISRRAIIFLLVAIFPFGSASRNRWAFAANVNKRRKSSSKRKGMDGLSSFRDDADEDQDDFRPRKRVRRRRVKFFPSEPTFAEKLLTKGKEAALVAAKLATLASREASKKGALVAAAASRVAKSKTSSPLERLLLQATVPTDTPVLSSDMSMIFSEIRSYGRGRQPGYNPYEKTLHKLWSKIKDNEWRTALKATEVLHRIARGAKSKERVRFSERVELLKRMTRDKSKGNPLKYKYFDARALTCEEGYAKFVAIYLEFVLMRLSKFTMNFKELKEESMVEDAKEVLEAALAISMNKKMKSSIVVCDCEYLIASDVEVLWQKLSELTKSLIDRPPTEDTVEMARWWIATLPQVESWHALYATTMSKINFTVPDFDAEAWVKTEDVRAFISNQTP